MMKKITFCIVALFLSLTFTPTLLKAGTEPSTLSTVASKNDKIAVSAEATVLLNRLDEIKAMDVSALNSSEKQVLRKEVRSIKSQLSEMSGGVYLSVGAILIILLVLIILF